MRTVRSDLQAALLLEARCVLCQRWPRCTQRPARGPADGLEAAGTGRGTDTVAQSLQSRGRPPLFQQTQHCGYRSGLRTGKLQVFVSLAGRENLGWKSS